MYEKRTVLSYSVIPSPGFLLLEWRVTHSLIYSMAKPAATPTAATMISLFQLIGLASPLKVATGALVVNVPLADFDGRTEIEAGFVGAWI